MSDKLDLSKLNDLDPQVRQRVENALKNTLETEIGRVHAGTAVMSPHSRSKGFFFSRSKSGDALRDTVTNPEGQLLQHVTTMDDASFAKFAERITTIKKAGS